MSSLTLKYQNYNASGVIVNTVVDTSFTVNAGLDKATMHQ
jgi:hypothetical protein